MSEISVVIPVYNVEDYLEECLNSICSQSFKDIEIICVDDGSTDGSSDILKEYASRDKRIKVISQDNQGLGASRNNGLDIAEGKYVYFIDGDDYIDSDALEKLHGNAVANGSDMVIFRFQTFGGDDNVHSRIEEYRIDEIFGDIDYSNFTFKYEDAKKHVLNTAFSACLKLYRKDFLDSFDDFRFPEGLAFEDIPFHANAMVRASRLSFVNEPLYHYRSNPKSILNYTADGFDIFKIIDMVEDFLKENGYYTNLEDEFIFFKVAQILVYIISTQSEDYFKKAKSEFSNLKIKDEQTLKKYALDGYQRVLNCESYEDYVNAYFNDKISQLEQTNHQLKEENKQLRKTNERLLSSSSWKMTKPFRFLRNRKM